MCIFCKIINGELSANKIFENDKIVAFYDIAPQAKVHLLVVPKIHFANIDSMKQEHVEYVTECFIQIPHIVKLVGLNNGYRLIINNGEDAGQLVPHLHIHVMGGERLSDSPIK